MFRKIPKWCAITTMGLGVGTTWGAEPASKSGRLPPVITVEQARLLQAPTPAAKPAPAAPTPPAPSPPASVEPATVSEAPALVTKGGHEPVTLGGVYNDHCQGCDCPDCIPHYLLPGRRNGCKPPPNNYYHRVLKPKLQASHWGYCDQFCERPFGPAVSAHFQHQIVNGLAAQMMLYEYDFQEVGNARSDGLSLRGRSQLERIAGRYQQGLGPVVIATDFSDPRLDEARRKAVERELKTLGVQVRAEDILVRSTPKPSYNAYEGLFQQRNREQMIMSRGAGVLSGVNSGGSGSAGAAAAQ